MGRTLKRVSKKANQEEVSMRKNTNRYLVLDGLRGITLINMIVYHSVWDIVYLFRIDWQWYHSIGAYIWQQCICWGFIFIDSYGEGFRKN